MSRPTQSWQAIRAEVERRLQDGVWQPGETIPTESNLSDEFGCARATVNRALRSLAEQGYLERRRKAGTRVAHAPSQRAIFRVPLLRAEVEAKGATYRHVLLEQTTSCPPSDVCLRMHLHAEQVALNLKTLHLADDIPYCLEDRWINPAVVDDLGSIDFSEQSANEYLLKNVPLSQGVLRLGACHATAEQAKLLHTPNAAALFEVNRTTWFKSVAVTDAQLLFPPGYRMKASI